MQPKPEVSSEFSPSRRPFGIDAEFLLQPLRIETGDQRLQPGQIFRQLADEIGHLRGQHRDQDDEGQHQHDDEGNQDDHRRHEAGQTEPLQPVGDRIEEIGQHHAGDEGQQDVAEDIEEQRQQDGRADQPEENLPAERDSRSGCRRHAAASSSVCLVCRLRHSRSYASAKPRDRPRPKPRSRPRTAI